MPRSTMPPAKKPIVAGCQEPSAIAMAGASSDQKLAAIMTPAARPSIRSSSLRLNVLVNRTGKAPTAVTPQVNRVPNSA